MIQQSERVVALSHDIKKRALEHYGPSKDISVINLGIPKPSFAMKKRTDFGFSRDDILLVTVGRLVRRKGLPEMLTVLKGLNDPHVKLLIVGDGPEKTRIENLARYLNLTDQVHFLGYVSDEAKYQLLKISDIYVSSSHHEGFGIVFLEAMATGLPVVCYDKGGQTDFLNDGQTGFLVQYADVDLLTKRIGEVSKSLSLRKQMSEFNIRYVEKFYISTCAASYENLYSSVLKQGEHGPPSPGEPA
jgi:glycosyltransferase involved in cell wall biosynthesis